MSLANGSKNSPTDSDFSLLSRAFLKNKAQKHAIIPDNARLIIQTANYTEEAENKTKSIIEGFSCCDAARFWRAGAEVDTLLQTASLPCDKEKAEKCRQLWDAIEKVQLYEAQSAAAKQGGSTMLRHLGEVRLGQTSAPVSDPGIGDIIFEAEGENECGKP